MCGPSGGSTLKGVNEPLPYIGYFSLILESQTLSKQIAYMLERPKHYDDDDRA